MHYRVLGPLDVRDGNGLPLVPPRRKQRVLLGLLLLSANETVTTARLIDELWPDQAPRSAGANLQSYVFGLRRLLGSESVPGAERIRTRRGGYLFHVDADELDSCAFEQLQSAGRELLRTGEPAAASELLTQALGLWRGRVLEDLHLPEGRQPELARLEERRLAVVEDRVEALLALGLFADVAAELVALTRMYPTRERLWEQLMIALYRSGRQADALAAYQTVYRLFGSELGIEPGSSMRRLHEQILRGDAALDAPAGRVRLAAPPRPRQLPLDAAEFTGRAEPLRSLDTLLGASAADPDSAVAPVLISGTAGVGKTALAIHWAYHAADRFPDGQVYANLHGYARTAPVRPIEALTRFLRALGVPAEQVPSEPEEAAALYRSVLADRRVLVVLDNAATPDQVRPLLPGGPSSKVLITSRDQLSGLVALDGARRISLNVLVPDEAAELIARVVGPDRVATAPEAVAELARLCGYLPLALRIAATTLLDRPDGTIADLVTMLRITDRLSMLAVAGDESAAVRAAFDLSYATLPAPARRLFRLLGSCPAEDFTEPVAAALAGLETGATTPLLDRLASAHLLERPHPGRFGFHDLIRLYAAERCREEDPPDAPAAADARLVAWYVRTSRVAAARFSPFLLRLPTTSVPDGGPSVAFDSSGDAASWLDDERHNLVAVARYAGRARLAAAAELSDALRGYFRQRRHSLDWLAVAHAGVAGATSAEDPSTKAAAQISLADANTCTGDVDEAAVHFGSAADLSRKAGWSQGEAVAIAGRGSNRQTAGRPDEAVDHYARALAINRSIGWVRGQAQNLSAMGLSYLGLGRPGHAAECLTEAVDLSRQAGDRSSEAHALNRLGLAYHAMGRLANAVTCFEDALAMAREIADHVAEAATLDSRAAVRRDLGEFEAALADAHAAVGLTEETAQHASLAFVRNTLATIELCIGEATRALDHHTEAADLARRSGNRPGECEAQIGLSAAHRTLRRYDLAAAHAELALSLAGDAVSRAAALTVQGDAYLTVGRISAAADAAELAVAAAHESGQRLSEARALVLLGRARAAEEQTDQAVLHWRGAYEIFSRAGAKPERTRVTGLLARTQRLAHR